MLAEEVPEMGHRGPKSLGGSPISLLLYVEDVEATLGGDARRRKIIGIGGARAIGPTS